VLQKLPKEQKELIIKNIQAYFELERDESIGDLAADGILDFMLKELGPIIYNQAIHDAHTTVVQQMARMEDELYALEQPVRKTR